MRRRGLHVESFILPLPLATGHGRFVDNRAGEGADCILLHELLQLFKVVRSPSEFCLQLVPIMMNALSAPFTVERWANPKCLI